MIVGPGRQIDVILIPLLIVAWFLVAWRAGVFSPRS
jgi:hypothetical protein